MVVSGFIENENSECSMGTSMLLHQYQGSTCQIYSFYDQGKRLLIKRLREEYLDDVRMVEIFHKEYETGRRISSPYLVEYVSMGEDEKGPFIVMEFVDGETLADALISRKDWFTSADNLLRFVSQLLECLQTLHNHQILHLDLKPDNILLTRVSSDVKVIDLGYCYSDTYFASAGKNNLFSAPEQLNGTNTFDVRTDLYAVGKMLEYICRSSEISVTKPLQQFIEKATQAEADRRYASAEEMSMAVSEALKPKPSYVLRATVLLAVFCCSLALYVFARTQQNRQVDLDEYRYTLLSDDSLTCSVDQYICNWPIPNPQNRCIFSPLSVDGKDYRVIQVGDSLFCRDSIIQTVSIPEGVVRLGAAMCMESQHIHSVSLPSTLQYISYDAFAGCEGLSHIMLPEGLQFIGHNAFVGTTSLRHIIIPSSIRILHQDCFTSSGIRSIVLPDSLEILERGVFFNCQSLRRIVLPVTLRRIGDYCFLHCDSLTEVVALNPVPIQISNVFASADSTILRTLFVSASSIELYQNAPYWQDFDNILPLSLEF